MKRGLAGVSASPYILTFHWPVKYTSSSKSITSVIDDIKSPTTNENSTSAAALGVVAKHPECIFTPPGTPISGILFSPNVLTISLVVPSPPAYTMTSTLDSINWFTNLFVSSAEVDRGVVPSET